MQSSDFVITIELDSGGTITLGGPGESGEYGEFFVEPREGEKTVGIDDEILALILGIREAEEKATS